MMGLWSFGDSPRTVFFLIALLVGVSPQGLATELPPAQSLVTLGIGQQWVLEGESFRQVSVANPEVAMVKFTPDQKQILITATQPGNSDLILWTHKGEKIIYPLRVISGNIRDHARELAELLAPLEGIRVRLIGERIVIDGKALRSEDVKRVSQMALSYPNTANLVELSPEVRPILVEEINRHLREYGFLNVQAKVVGNQIYLSGDILDEAKHRQVLALAHEFYPEIVDLVQIGNDSHPAIRLDLTLVEINRTHLLSLGIRWQEALLASGNISISTAGSTYGLSANPTATLDLVEKKGWGRILTQPSLVCRSGSEANFHAGGEIPIRLVSERTADIIFKPYGILLKMAPAILAKKDISLRVETEISTLDGANSIDGIPALLTRRVSTVATIAAGKGLILAGLTDQNDLKNSSRIPLLGHIPGLGELFKSRNFRDGKTELVVFIQPQIVEPLEGRIVLEQTDKKYEEANKWFRPKWND